jgi:hypothetical protein
VLTRTVLLIVVMAGVLQASFVTSGTPVQGGQNLTTPTGIPYINLPGSLSQDTTIGPWVDPINHRVGYFTKIPAQPFSLGNTSLPGGDFLIAQNFDYLTGGAGTGQPAILTYYGGMYLGYAAGDPSYGIDVVPFHGGSTRLLYFDTTVFCGTGPFPTLNCNNFIGDSGVNTNMVTGSPHGSSGGTGLSISGCGGATLNVGSSAVAGTITSGVTGVCTFTVSLTGVTYPTGAAFFFNNLTTSANPLTITAETAGSVTVTGTTVTGDQIRFGSIGY